MEVSTTLASSTTVAAQDSWITLPIMGLLGIIASLAIALVSCATVICIKVCSTGERSETRCGRWCVANCVQEDGDAEENQVDENSNHHDPTWDPPRYRDALRMQRLDSTTISGTPPPVYESLDIKGASLGHDNKAFKSHEHFPPFASRSVSVITLEFDAIVERTDLSVLNDQGNFSISPISHLFGGVGSGDALTDRRHTSFDIDISVPDEILESSISAGDSTQEAHVTDDNMTSNTNVASGDLDIAPVHSETSQLSSDQGQNSGCLGSEAQHVCTVSERIENNNNNVHDKHVNRGISDILPSYADVLSWIKGTNM